jgi:hypothetical protein
MIIVPVKGQANEIAVRSTNSRISRDRSLRCYMQNVSGLDSLLESPKLPLRESTLAHVVLPILSVTGSPNPGSPELSVQSYW